MKKITFFLFISFCYLSFSQLKYSKELSVINDNDVYTSLSLTKDRYYTNGLFLSYRYLSNKKYENNQKKIYEFLIGQHIYTPIRPTIRNPLLQDRPFAGYLYGSFGINYFFQDNSILKLSSQVGVVGSASFGEETIKLIHTILGLKKIRGWEYQIDETLGINFNVNYIKSIAINKTKTVDFNWYNDIKTGTIFTDISTGFHTRLSLNPLQDLNNSIAFNGNFNDSESDSFNKPEFFIFIKPIISYVLHDTTIQGSLFNDNSPVTYDIIPIKFSSEVGLQFTVKRFNLAYVFHYHTKKLRSPRARNYNYYASIKINYQFN